MTLEVDSGWQALRRDPLPWLLDEGRPGLCWRTLLELVGRSPDSAAAQRARGGASAAEPVATLLERLLPDGRWDMGTPEWHRHRGPSWRLVAATELGADPADPRLQAAAGRLFATATGVGGFEERPGAGPSAVATARAVQAVCFLGWGRHLRVQEALAWLEEGALPTLRGGSRAVVAVAALRAAAETGRRALLAKAGGVLVDWLGTRSVRGASSFGHPRLTSTDQLEALWALARAGHPWDERLGPSLRRLQEAADAEGRWWRRDPTPRTLPIPAVPGPSRWLTLRAAVAVTTYAVSARLPRLFPAAP